MDELFLLPSCPVAMPRAYWLDPNGRTMSSQLFVIEPSDFEFGRIMESISHAGGSEYDMEIFNELYKDSALIIPHRPYNLLTGEFRSESHTAYLGNPLEQWDPDLALSEAKYLHFSDWPVPKVGDFFFFFCCEIIVLSGFLEKNKLLTKSPSYSLGSKPAPM